MKERAKYIGLGFGKGIESKLNKVLSNIEGEFVQLQLIQSGLAQYAVLIYIPKEEKPKPNN